MMAERDTIKEAFEHDQTFKALLKDDIFVDYFNTFLSLPVFPKRLMYRPDSEDFEIEPPIKRTTHHLLSDRVLTWTRVHRAQVFLNTPICNEYRLCVALVQLPVLLKHDFLSDEELSFQQRIYLSRVACIKKLKRYLLGTAGGNLLAFWIDAERFRRQVGQNCRRFVLKEIQEKFLVPLAPFKLGISVCNAINNIVKHELVKSSNEFLPSTLLVSSQKVIMECVSDYWLPKYMFHRLKRRNIVMNRWKSIKTSKTEVEESKPSEEVTELNVINNLKKRIKQRKKKTMEEGVEMKVVDVDPVESDSSNESIHTINMTDNRRGNDNIFMKTEILENYINDLVITPKKRKKNRLKTKFTVKVRSSSVEETGNVKLLQTKRRSESSLSSYQSTTTQLPEFGKSFASDQVQPMVKSTLFEAIHVENEYEADNEEDVGLDCDQSTQVCSLPPIYQTEGKIFPAERVPSIHHRLKTPFSSHFILENILQPEIGRGKQFDLLVAALTMDTIAGQPLIAFFQKKNYKVAEANLRFWTAANQILSDSNENLPAIRQKQYQALIQMYLRENCEIQTSLSPSTKKQLCKLLQNDIGTTRLYEASNEIVDVLLPHWEEFLKSDNQSFLKHVTKLKRNVYQKDAQLKITSLNNDKLNEFDLTIGAGFVFGKVSLNDDDKRVHRTRMWKAMKLALSICVPKKAKKEPTKQENEEMESSDEIDEVVLFHGSLNLQYLKDLSVKAQLRNVGKLKKLFNEKGLTHNYVGWGGYNACFVERDDKECREITSTPERTQKPDAKPPRPRSFYEVLNNSTQLEYFRRYLIKLKKETPIMFWCAVESMRSASQNAKSRQTRAHGIVKRYFGPSSNNGQDLNCHADIIKEICNMENVSPAMLVSAQICVAKTLEENHYADYLRTFQNEGGMTGITLLPVYNSVEKNGPEVVIRTVKQKSKGLWRMFTRNVISFRRGIMNPGTLKVFENFLNLQNQLNRSQFKAHHADTSQMTTSRVTVNNKLIYTDKLVADLHFWSEVERYKDFADAVVLCAKLGNYTKDDEQIVVKKAITIVDCFINSQIAPKNQINISSDLSEKIINMVNNGIIERGLFHDAALSTFSTLIHFWKKFCLYRFLPRDQGPVYEKKRKNYRSALIAQRERDLRSNKWKTVNLTAEEECTKLMFSLQFGLRIALIRSPRKKKDGTLPDTLSNQTLSCEASSPKIPYRMLSVNTRLHQEPSQLIN